MPKTNTKQGNWDYDLRNRIKRKFGKGWLLRGKGNATQLSHTYEDGSKQFVTIPIKWEAENDTAIENAVITLVDRMKKFNISLKAASETSKRVQGVATADGVKAGVTNWQAVADAFLETRSGHRVTTKRDTTKRVHNAVALLEAKPKPSDGPDLMKAYASAYFKQCPAGGAGRKRHLGDVTAFLTYAVKKCGADGRWMPMEADEIDQLIGTADTHDEDTPPVRPEQLAALLDHLSDNDMPQLWLAVALVGMYGLRPAELKALFVEDGKLYVRSTVKRNKRTMKAPKPPRRVIALELHGRDDGARALAQFDSGLVKLPKGIRTAIEGEEYKPVGDAFRQYLDRLPFWQSMVAATKGLTPYGMRHGWAYRAHKYYDRPLSVRDASALMGHTPTTHNRHYGRWVTEEDLEAAVARITTVQSAAVGVGLEF